MKKILALLLASALVISSSFSAFAADTPTSNTGEGSKSVTAEDIEKLTEEDSV